MPKRSSSSKRKHSSAKKKKASTSTKAERHNLSSMSSPSSHLLASTGILPLYSPYIPRKSLNAYVDPSTPFSPHLRFQQKLLEETPHGLNKYVQMQNNGMAMHNMLKTLKDPDVSVLTDRPVNEVFQLPRTLQPAQAGGSSAMNDLEPNLKMTYTAFTPMRNILPDDSYYIPLDKKTDAEKIWKTKHILTHNIDGVPPRVKNLFVVDPAEAPEKKKGLFGLTGLAGVSPFASVDLVPEPYMLANLL